jgi:hypothetical protein
VTITGRPWVSPIFSRTDDKKVLPLLQEPVLLHHHQEQQEKSYCGPPQATLASTRLYFVPGYPST